MYLFKEACPARCLVCLVWCYNDALIVYLVWPRISHHEELFLKMTPAVEDGEDGEEEEDMAPLQEEVVRVESLQGAGGDDPQHHQVERKPGDQERSLPAAQTVASQADKGKVRNLFVLF